MRRLLMLGLAVVGFQFGCGVEEAAPGAQPEMGSREDELVICLVDSYTVFYSDATYTTEVGSDRCFCNEFPIRTGRRTPFFIEYINEECPGVAPKTP